jgi:hypothetical protein
MHSSRKYDSRRSVALRYGDLSIPEFYPFTSGLTHSKALDWVNGITNYGVDGKFGS